MKPAIVGKSVLCNDDGWLELVSGELDQGFSQRGAMQPPPNSLLRGGRRAIPADQDNGWEAMTGVS